VWQLLVVIHHHVGVNHTEELQVVKVLPIGGHFRTGGRQQGKVLAYSDFVLHLVLLLTGYTFLKYFVVDVVKSAGVLILYLV